MDQREAAVAYLERGAVPRAESALRSWVRSDPHDLYAHWYLLRLLHKRSGPGSPRLVESFYDEELPTAPGSPLGYFVRAETMLRADGTHDACRTYEAALEAGLRDPVVYFRLGEALLKRGQDDAALAQFKAALRRDRQFIPATYQCVRLLFDIGRMDWALQAIRRFHRDDSSGLAKRFVGGAKIVEWIIDFENAILTLRKAVQLARCDKPREAAERLWPVVLAYPDNAPVLRTFAFLLNRSHPKRPFEARMKQIIERAQDAREYARGLMNWHLGEPQEAVNAYSAAIDGEYDHPLVRNARARAFMVMGDHDRAKADLEEAHHQASWLLTVRAQLAKLAFIGGAYHEISRLRTVPNMEIRHALAFEVSAQDHLEEIEAFYQWSRLRCGHYREALLAATDRGNSHEAWHMAIGLASAANEEWEAAERRFRCVLDTDEDIVRFVDDTEASLIHMTAVQTGGFASSLLDAIRPAFGGNIQATTEALAEIPNKHDEEFVLWLHRGRTAELQKKHEEAELAYRRAISCEPSPRRAVSRLRRFLYRKGDIEGLMALLKLADDCSAPEWALDLAVSRELPIDELCQLVLRHRCGDFFSVAEVLGTRDWSFWELGDLEAASKIVGPLDFESREWIAGLFLKKGSAIRARSLYTDLRRNDQSSLGLAIRWAISCLPSCAQLQSNSGPLSEGYERGPSR